jgi:hypothetical protein
VSTTGGGPLLKLNANTGELIEAYAYFTGITQALAIHPVTGEIYVSSGDGIKVFDPNSKTFTHYSDLRVGNLAFGPDDKLWGAVWPQRGEIVNFTEIRDVTGRLVRTTPQLMARFNDAVDSIAFGQLNTELAGLLFVSTNNGDLEVIDLDSMRTLTLAEGGSRGDIIRTTKDGQILLSQSAQIDILSPIRQPRVAATNPPDDARVTLPNSTLTVTFDQAMFVGAATDSASVLNPNNYQLTWLNSANVVQGNITPTSVSYNATTRTAQLVFDNLIPSQYQLRVNGSVRSQRNQTIGEDYVTDFTAISDFLANVDLQFINTRSDRNQETASWDVTVKNKGTYDLVVPLALLLDPAQSFTGVIPGQRTDLGYLLDLSASLPTNGILRAGATTTAQVITVNNPDQLRIAFASGIYTLPGDNQAPVINSQPITTALVGQPILDFKFAILD